MTHETPAIRLIPAADTRAVRHQVLRPHLPPESAIFPRDDEPQTLHLGALVAGQVVGVVTLFPAPSPQAVTAGAWQLRGMATLPAVRGTGVGGLLLEASFVHVAAAGGRLIWCNARESAAGFYERYGFAKVSERFEVAAFGPHVIMTRALEPPEAP